ncbi:esterase [Acrocarpospora phusangensis]|uniref:Esterase n=1 Tax=Acrocarpospora phusangensis TaxID=1070424 RepID=A0A919QCP5_9ACTN|nr:alpha/beta fold hydrolase [Acrocarpospora phusangensis]GIH24190.1 esterase [Acrocarpospora phusangensis]
MSTYVLVPGFWLGAWAWKDVVADLRATGHTAYPVSLTGLADRAHLASPALTPDDHIADIVNLITYEDLHDVILVGHSGSGGVVTAAADRIPERVARIVYVDSGPVPDGVAQIDLAGREDVEAALVDGFRLPFVPLEIQGQAGTSLDGLTRETMDLITARATAHPYGPISRPFALTGAWDKLPKTLVSCQFSTAEIAELRAQGHPYFAAMAGPEWEIRELSTSHWPMFSRPADLSALLRAVAFTK